MLSHESADFVVRRLFTAGLALGSCVRLLDRERAKRLTAVIGELDDIGRDVRRAALADGRQSAQIGGDPHRQALIAGMNHVVAEITSRLDSLGRAEVAERVPSPHLLDAVQSLERALAYLRDGTPERATPGELSAEEVTGPEPVRPHELHAAARLAMGRGPEALHAATEATR